MANYTVGCGIFGEIQAGILNKEGTMWRNSSNCTDAAISSVMAHMMIKADNKGAQGYSYSNTDRKGRKITLTLTIEEQPNEKNK